ncbi:MAG TPA: response regulator, partial [Terriglobia bacterium]|nr:response regulator [Terriglobia bacterium]
HLTLTDIVMPQMNGRELARRLTALHPETKVLYMTGYAGNKIGGMEVLEEDAQFIQKPFSAESLGDKIRSILDGK